MSRKVHYSSDELWAKERWVVCGQTVMKEVAYTTNPAEVTCKACKVVIKTIGKAMKV